MKEIWRVVQNYESLTQEEKARVPTISYYRAKVLFTTDGRPIVPRPQKTEHAPVHPFPQLTERHPRVLTRNNPIKGEQTQKNRFWEPYQGGWLRSVPVS